MGNEFQLPSCKNKSRRRHVFQIIDALRKKQSYKMTKNNAGSRPYHVTKYTGPLVAVGPTDWIRGAGKNHTNSGGGHLGNGGGGMIPQTTSAHILSCDTIGNKLKTKSIVSWLNCRDEKRRPCLLWANLKVVSKKNGVEQMESAMKEIIDNVPSTTPLLFIYQQNFSKAMKLSQRRKLSTSSKKQHSKMTLAWTENDEMEWKYIMDSCGACEVVWICCANK